MQVFNKIEKENEEERKDEKREELSEKKRRLTANGKPFCTCHLRVRARLREKTIHEGEIKLSCHSKIRVFVGFCTGRTTNRLFTFGDGYEKWSQSSW